MEAQLATAGEQRRLVYVSTLDLALGLRVIRRPTHMLHTLILKPLGQIASHVRCAIVREKSWPVHDGGAIKPRWRKRQVERFGHIRRRSCAEHSIETQSKSPRDWWVAGV